MTTKDFNFPIKIINKEDIEKYILTLKNNEKQLLVTDSGIYLTNGNKEVKEITKKTDLDLGKEELLTSSKTIKGAINEVFQKSYRGKELVANAVGDMNLATKSYIEISNIIIENKKQIVEALQNKGVITDVNVSLGNYADKINSIIQESTLKNTKLNMKKGETKVIELTNPIDMEHCCTSVLEYQAGEDNVVYYNCNFDNSDSNNFDFDESIEFENGTMEQKNKNFKAEMLFESEDEKYKYTNAKFNIDDFYSISEIKVVDSDNDNKQFLQVIGTYNPTLVIGKEDINLIGIDKVKKFEWIGDIEKNNKMKFVFSVDSGITWKTFNKETNEINVVNIKNKDSIEKSINTQDLNNLDEKQLGIIFQNISKIKFGYYFEKYDANNKLNNDKISIHVDMKGKSIPSKNVDWNLSEDGKKIIYNILKDGTYTVLWVDKEK